MPVHIGEAADTAFATRFRQALTEDQNLPHIPRTHYVSDSRLASLAEMDCAWPTPSRARLLVRFALDTIGSCYHCVRKSQVYRALKQHYRSPRDTSTVFTCKLWALFALGEAYSSRTSSISDDNFPGLAYFARASRVLRNLRERPQIGTVEILLLLVRTFPSYLPCPAHQLTPAQSLYSLLMNRRYNVLLPSELCRSGVYHHGHALGNARVSFSGPSGPRTPQAYMVDVVYLRSSLGVQDGTPRLCRGR